LQGPKRDAVRSCCELKKRNIGCGIDELQKIGISGMVKIHYIEEKHAGSEVLGGIRGKKGDCGRAYKSPAKKERKQINKKRGGGDWGNKKKKRRWWGFRGERRGLQGAQEGGKYMNVRRGLKIIK